MKSKRSTEGDPEKRHPYFLSFFFSFFFIYFFALGGRRESSRCAFLSFFLFFFLSFFLSFFFSSFLFVSLFVIYVLLKRCQIVYQIQLHNLFYLILLTVLINDSGCESDKFRMKLKKGLRRVWHAPKRHIASDASAFNRLSAR